MADLDEIRRLAEAAIDSDLAHHSGDVTLDATTFYLPVLDLLDEIERLREALLRVTEAGCDECHEGGCKEFHGPLAWTGGSGAKPASLRSTPERPSLPRRCPMADRPVLALATMVLVLGTILAALAYTLILGVA